MKLVREISNQVSLRIAFEEAGILKPQVKDLDTYCDGKHNCCLINLDDMLKNGIKIGEE